MGHLHLVLSFVTSLFHCVCMCPIGSQGSNSDHKQRRPISVSHIVLGLLASILKGGGEEEVKDKKLQFEADMIIYLKNKN